MPLYKDIGAGRRSLIRAIVANFIYGIIFVEVLIGMWLGFLTIAVLVCQKIDDGRD
jgi:hypothetical protein